MTAILTKDSVGSLVVYLEDSAGSAVTGLLDVDVTAAIKKNGAGSFTSFTLTPTNFVELGSGFYEITLDTTDTDVVGTLYIRVQGPTVRTYLSDVYIAASAVVNIPVVSPPSTVVIFGYVYGPDASPLAQASVSARVVGVPTVLYPGSEGILVSQDLVTSRTDNDGFFTLDLITGTYVDIIISSANYRRTIKVPGVSTNLFSIV